VIIAPQPARQHSRVASGLGRILRDRGIDTTAATTEVQACDGKSEAECVAIKRPGGPLDGVHRSRNYPQ
jgi:hypothetical protein